MAPAQDVHFREAVLLFDRYYRWQDRTHPIFPRDRAMEARRRLLQLDWILCKVRETEAQIATHCVPTDTDIQLFLQLSEELQFFTESFYYFGWRTREIVKSLPGLASFEAIGLRDVRNHLLEHPEKQSKVFIESFSYGGAAGPTLKGPRYADQVEVFPDPGLYVNAREFVENFVQRARAIVPHDQE